MGCDIHAVLQERQEDGTWETRLYDVIPDRDYTLFDFLSGVRGGSQGIASSGVPAGFDVNDDNEHNNFWMGEHSFGHIAVEDFCRAPVNGFDKDDRRRLRRLQEGFIKLLGYPSNYIDVPSVCKFRLVFGYDN